MLLHSDNMQNPLDTLQTPQTQHRHPPERQYLKALVAAKQDNTKLTFPTFLNTTTDNKQDPSDNNQTPSRHHIHPQTDSKAIRGNATDT